LFLTADATDTVVGTWIFFCVSMVSYIDVSSTIFGATLILPFGGSGKELRRLMMISVLVSMFLFRCEGEMC
jgi:hypothetical protein